MTDKPGKLMDAGLVGPLVYVLDCDQGTKVGITIQSLEERLRDLSRASGMVDIRVVRTWPFSTRSRAHTVEQVAHWLLRDTRTVGEWFHCHPLEACDAVESVIRKGIPVAYYVRNDPDQEGALAAIAEAAARRAA